MNTDQTLNRREFIKQVLQGRRSERIPRAVFGGGLWSYWQAGLRIEDLSIDPVNFGDRIADVWRNLDTDIIFLGSGFNTLPAEAIGGELKFEGNKAPLLAFPVIQTSEDARHFGNVDITGSPHTEALMTMIKRVRESLPDRYLCATSWGPFTWGMILCDWQVLQEKSISDPEFIREVCELGLRLSLAFYMPLIRQGLIDGISVPDGAVTLVSSDLYRNVILPIEKKLFDQIRKEGVGCFLHQCGNIAPQIEIYPETGADCITVDAVVDIGSVYDLYHSRTVTAGNVDVINVVFGGSLDLIRDTTAECIAAVSDPYSKFILMPSCDLPPETPINNVKEFLACADRVKPGTENCQSKQ